jgi:hypothetical protein
MDSGPSDFNMKLQPPENDSRPLPQGFTKLFLTTMTGRQFFMCFALSKSIQVSATFCH